MTEYREICGADDAQLAGIIRKNLKTYKLDIPGTAFFDSNLDRLSEFYLSDRSKRYYCVAVEEGEVIGGIGLADPGLFEDTAELQKLYLKDEVKGRGLSYELVRLIEAKARELGYRHMYLETHSNLEIAIHLYEKCGYREIDRPESVVHTTMDRFFFKDL